jgi:potassium-dependent mechanosensitive channel
MARFFFALLLLALTLSSPARALDEAAIGQAERAAQSFRADLRKIQAAVDSPAVTDDELNVFRGELDAIGGKASSQATSLEPASKEVSEQLARLGAAPPAGQAESAEIAAQRKLLNDINGKLSGARAQLQLVSVEAEQASGQTATLQRDRFFTRIFAPSRSILNPGLWADAAKGFATTGQRVSRLVRTWWQMVRMAADWLPLGALVLVLLLLGIIWTLGRRLWHTRFAGASEHGPPDNLTRLWFAVWSVAGTVLASLLVTLVVFSLLDEAGLMTPRFQLLLTALAKFSIEAIFLLALVYRIADPGRPEWRLINVDGAAASRFAGLAGISALLVAAARAFRAVADGIYLSVDNTVSISALASLALLAICALIMRNFRLAEPNAAIRRSYFNWASRAAPVVWMLLAVAAFSLLLGYVALANYVLFTLFNTTVLLAALALIQATADAASQASVDSATPLGRFVRRMTGWSDRAVERGALVFRTTTDLLVALFGIFALIGLWAVAWIDFRSLASRAFFNVELGNVTISLWSILLVVLILVLGIAATKAIVGWLDRRILTRVRLERGVQDSVRTGIKYAGYVVAVGFALSAAGINFSNLALVAGAFGVGIGFGLQSIVNNFVSGLILLAERPVRVGDWIITNAGEGLVKRINVRSTEIETFDGCSIIVPNSTLITEPVRNWTLGDTGGRVTVSVSIPYSEDAEKIAAMLQKIMASNAKILSYPEPQVLLSKFGAYALEFDMKFSIADIFEGVPIASDIRVAILKALAEKGVAIPVPPNVSVIR